jgi:hypothetical protein
MMTAKSRYWDHERCCWVTFEPSAATSVSGGSSVLASDALPEQRTDDETLPAEVG